MPEYEIERELTPQEQVVLSKYLQGKSQHAIARDIGVVPSKVNSITKDPIFRDELKKRLSEVGMDDTGIANKLAELLEAKQFGLTKDGDVVEMGPDAHAQNKTMDMILKVTGSYPDPRIDINAKIGPTIVYVGPDDMLTPGDIFQDVIDVTPPLEIEENQSDRSDNLYHSDEILTG